MLRQHIPRTIIYTLVAFMVLQLIISLRYSSLVRKMTLFQVGFKMWNIGEKGITANTSQMISNNTSLTSNEKNVIMNTLGQYAATPCRQTSNKSLYGTIDTLISPRIHNLQDDEKQYFVISGQKTCFIEGTDPKSLSDDGTKCKCKELWYGEDCSLPETFVGSDIPKSYNITRRTKPRRLIHAFPFNIEFDMVEAVFSDLGDVVDVFIISESNYTGHGDPKPLRLLERLKSGFCGNLQHKIVHMFVGFFPQAAYKNGWIADDLPRDELGSRGIREQITGIRHDDIFILTDADEIPTRDTLLFLKLHDGFPEPFGFHLHRTAFGFFWLSGNGDCPILSGATVGFLNHVFEGKASKIRNTVGHLAEVKHNLNAYIKSGGLVHIWRFGNKSFKAGWHCSWCFRIPGIQIKLKSAINADFPRWGDYPEKGTTTYLKNMLIKGLWFNGRTLAEDPRKARVNPSYKMYAPRHILNNSARFHYLLKHPNA